MNTRSRFLSAFMAVLFAFTVMFSGLVSAAHCEHEPEPLESWELYDE